MNANDLIRLGVPVGEPIRLAHELIQDSVAQGSDSAPLEIDSIELAISRNRIVLCEVNPDFDEVYFRERTAIDRAISSGARLRSGRGLSA